MDSKRKNILLGRLNIFKTCVKIDRRIEDKFNPIQIHPFFQKFFYFVINGME